MILNGRTYRSVEASDYPKLALKQLTVKRINFQGLVHDVVLISPRCSNAGSADTAWLCTYPGSKDYIIYGSADIWVDVTPEKRYAIWHQPTQRFKNASHSDGGVKIYLNRQDAEIELEEWFRKNSIANAKKYWYIVEWEIKQDAE
jgi:hypothetical protein